MARKFPVKQTPIVLVDLDDTLAESNGYEGWNVIGHPRDYAHEFVWQFKRHGWKTVLWSTRAEVGRLKQWLIDHRFTDDEFGEGLACDIDGNLLFDYIGQSPINPFFGSNPAKPVADLIIDNSAWPFCGEPVPLEDVMNDLLGRGILTWQTRSVAVT